MNQKIFYQPIKNWLEAQGFKVLISGNNSSVVLPIWDLTPMAYKVPDLIGVNDKRKVVIVEVEQDRKKLTDVIGKCMIWKCIATFVYIAYPEKVIPKIIILNRLGLGQLNVNEKGEVKEIIQILHEESIKLHNILELHPLDHSKESHLAEQLKKII